MTGLNVDAVGLEGFGLVTTLSGTRAIVKLTGTADMEAVIPMRRSFAQIRQEADRLRLNQVEVDFRELYFISSSCIKVLLLFVTSGANGGVDCPVQFTVDAKLTWQRRALMPVQRFAPHIISLVER